MRLRIVAPKGTQADTLSGFRFWWLKYVRGWDPMEHCSKCLRGGYEERITRTMATGQWVELKTHRYDYAYLCGVSPRYETNFHLVLKHEGDARACVETYNGYQVEVEGGSAVEILPLPQGWRGYKAAYTTCRNFQFGAQAYGANLCLPHPLVKP